MIKNTPWHRIELNALLLLLNFVVVVVVVSSSSILLLLVVLQLCNYGEDGTREQTCRRGQSLILHTSLQSAKGGRRKRDAVDEEADGRWQLNILL